jgi:intracellular sulfur oxidation DsrE/DsrF family protein
MRATTLCILVLTLTLSFPALSGNKNDVVYHLTDAEKVSFVLTNISNHIQGAGGPDKVNIVLVIHGPAIQAFNDIEAVDRVRNRASGLHQQGVAFNVCGNSLKAMDLSLDELLPGMVEVSQGVTRIAELQSRGYIYIRP